MFATLHLVVQWHKIKCVLSLLCPLSFMHHPMSIMEWRVLQIVFTRHCCWRTLSLTLTLALLNHFKTGPYHAISRTCNQRIISVLVCAFQALTPISAVRPLMIDSFRLLFYRYQDNLCLLALYKAIWNAPPWSKIQPKQLPCADV